MCSLVEGTDFSNEVRLQPTVKTYQGSFFFTCAELLYDCFEQRICSRYWLFPVFCIDMSVMVACCRDYQLTWKHVGIDIRKGI